MFLFSQQFCDHKDLKLVNIDNDHVIFPVGYFQSLYFPVGKISILPPK